jgi:DNA-binding NarL/FixJ family response regulator
MDRIKILIADDTTLMRRLLAQQMAREPNIEVVGEAEDGREAVELTLRCRPDVVLMDLNMPHLNGIQAMERIRAQQPYTKVILLTAHEDLASLGRFSGAADCLDKGCTPQELVGAIRRAHATATPDPAEAGGGNDHHASIERLAVRAGFSEREKIVVQRMVSTEMTMNQVARALSAELKTEVTESSVKHALERAMIKLKIEPRTRAALVKYVLEFGKSA